MRIVVDLPAPLGPRAEDLPAPDGEVDAGEGPHGSVVLDELLGADHQVRHLPASFASGDAVEPSANACRICAAASSVSTPSPRISSAGPK